MEDLEQYLQPNEFFDFNAPNVKQKAIEVTKGCETDSEKARALFYYVRDEFRYNAHLFIPMFKEMFIASEVIESGRGFCVSKSILLASLARAVNIPARLHLWDLINHLISPKLVEMMGTNIMHYHGHGELYLNNKWVKLTPSFDEGTAKKAGFLPMCEFVDDEDSLFPPHDINGKQFGEYVFDRGVHADLPLQEISRVFQEKYAGFKMLAKLYESGQIKSIEDIPRMNSAKY